MMHESRAPGSAPNGAETAPNYRYWQQEGADWPDEYDRRKLVQPQFHAQEVMLAQYIASSGTVRVLEYGCGFGRHLSYLSRLPNVDIHGVDQSPTMLGGMRRWAKDDWIAQHAQRIAPVGDLPFEDGAFDIVYTAEVLVHIRPSDLPKILSELLRVSKWQVLHLEPSPDTNIVSAEHGGCWNHDLPAVYRELGITCEMLPSGYRFQSPYRVVLDPSRPVFNWSPVVLELLARFDREMDQSLAQRAELAGRLDGELAATREVLLREQTERQLSQHRIRDLESELKSVWETLNRTSIEAHELREGLRQAFGMEAAPVTQDAFPSRVRELRRQLEDMRSGMVSRIAEHRLARAAVKRVRRAALLTSDSVSIEWRPPPKSGVGGNEAWLLGVYSDRSDIAEPWESAIATTGDWRAALDANAPYGRSTVAHGPGVVTLPTRGRRLRLRLLAHPWSASVVVRYRELERTIDLYAATPSLVEVIVDRSQGIDVRHEERASTQTAKPAPRGSWTDEDAAWLDAVGKSKPACVAMHVPRWLGVSASTAILFETRLPLPRTATQVPGDIGDDDVDYNARLLAESGVPHVVFSGGDLIQLKVATALKRLRPQVRCDLLWHGSSTQMHDDYHWKTLNQWISACRAGLVSSIATVKKGFEDTLRHAGVKSRFLANYVPTIPNVASVPADGGTHLGLWLSGSSQLKSPYAMVAASASIPNALLHVAGVGTRVLEVARLLDVPVKVEAEKPLPHDVLLAAIKKTHLSLYVTLSECTPMLPLESLSVGVPCLLGPASHLFEGDDYLWSRLVVPYPERSDVIARMAAQAIDERGTIVERYKTWAKAYNADAIRLREAFLADW